MNNNKTTKTDIDIEKKVMGKIRSGKVTLRSKYIFLAEKLGVGSVIVFTILLAILFFNLVLFYLKASDNLAYLSFGRFGMLAFLESFPYWLVIVFILLIFIAGYFLKKSAFAYKKPFGWLTLILIVLILLAGTGLAFTKIGFNERFEREALGPHSRLPFARHFMPGGWREFSRGVAGKIVLIKNDHLIAQTPRALERIYFAGLPVEQIRAARVGDLAVFIGERREGDFYAQDMRVLNPNEMPMIERNILRRHGDRRMPKPPMPLFPLF